MNTPSLAPVCIAFSTPVASVLMTRLILELLQKSARNNRAALDARSGVRAAAYPTAARAVAWIILVICVGVAGFVGTIKAARQEPSVIGISVLILMLAAAMVTEFTQLRVEWTDAELNFASPWGPLRRLRWTDIVDVNYSATAQWFVIRGRDGTKIRLHNVLGGLRELLKEMQRRTSVEVSGQIEAAMRMAFPS